MSGPCSACGDGDTAMRYHNHSELRLVQPSLYTLTEIEQLAHSYTDTLETTDCSKLSVQLTLSAWLKWIEKREKEEGGG